MRSGSVFVIIFACVLNVAFTSYVHRTDSDGTRSTRMMRDVSTDSKHQKCYEEFTLKTDAFLAEVKDKSLECAKTIEKGTNNFDLLNADERNKLQSFVENKMKTIHADLEACSKKTSAAEYFRCLRSFETANRAFLDDVNEKSKPYLYEMEKVEQDERNCLSEIVDEDQSNSPALTLRRCIMANPQAISNTTPSSTPSIPSTYSANYGMDFYIAKLKRTYATLNDCVGFRNGGDIKNKFNKCLNEAKNNIDLRDYLRKDPPVYFSKLNEIDKTEDICLRHLASIFISKSDTSNYYGELLKCLQNGRAKASRSEDLDYNMRSQLERLFNSLDRCKYYEGGVSEIEDCVNETFTKEAILVDNCYSILDENLKTLVARSNIHSSCLTYVLKKLQFGGVFMDLRDRERFNNCYRLDDPDY